MTTGGSNTACGMQALYTASTAAANTAVGAAALYASNATSNTAVGYSALYGITGGYNSALGRSAGQYLADGTTANQTATHSTYVGYKAMASAGSVTNETVVGDLAIGAGSNTVALGSAAVTAWVPGASNVCDLGTTVRGFKTLYLHDGTDEWAVTINAAGALLTAKV